jgi:hypothetical protein
VPKVELCGLGPELKADVAALVQAALAQMHPGYDSPSIKPDPSIVDNSLSTTQELAETEQKYKAVISSLEAQLAASNNQVQDIHAVLDKLKSQLDMQRGKTRQLEQRILQLTKAEVTLKATNNQFRAERDAAVARERQAILAKDQLEVNNAQLCSQLSDLQNEHELTLAQLNDATYKHQQLENRISQLNGENSYWRQYSCSQATSMGAPVRPGPVGNAQSSCPPARVRVSAPAARRHTVPNVFPVPSIPVAQAAPVNISRPSKHARTDSIDSISAGSNGTRSRVSSDSSTTFALRPMKIEPADPTQFSTAASAASPSDSTRYPSHIYAPGAHALPYGSQQAPSAAPISYPVQTYLRPMTSYAPVPVPVSQPLPAATTSPASIHQPTLFPPSLASGAGPVPTYASMHTPATRVNIVSTHMHQFLAQLFIISPTGKPECKFCK